VDLVNYLVSSGQTLIEGSQSFVEFPSLYVKAYNNVSNFRMGVILGDAVGPIRVVKSLVVHQNANI